MLKRIIIAALCIAVLLFIGCTKESSEGPDAKPTPEGLTDSALEIPEEAPVEYPLGLYINMGNGTRDLKTQVATDFIVGKDLVVLSAFATTQPAISGSKFGPVWSSYWDALPDLLLYKIGYCLSYKLNDGDTITQMIYSPKDTESGREYLETYIYDDVHQSGWYSHLLAADMTDETVITSVKLTGGANVSEVSEVKLEAFLYKAGDTTDRAGSYTVEVEKR